MRVVITESSIWTFDMKEKMYVRVPRDENSTYKIELAKGRIPYTYEREPFEELVPLESPWGPKLLVIRPVPLGTGRLRETGVIISDTEEEESNDG